MFDSYTPFGEQLGEAVSGFTYNAEYYDASTGMLNLRARQYEPTMMRFSQKDILQGSIYEPISLNRYLYCQNDPMSFSDPSGMSVWSKLKSAAKSTGKALKSTAKAVGAKAVSTAAKVTKTVAKTVSKVSTTVAKVSNTISKTATKIATNSNSKIVKSIANGVAKTANKVTTVAKKVTATANKIEKIADQVAKTYDKIAEDAWADAKKNFNDAAKDFNEAAQEAKENIKCAVQTNNLTVALASTLLTTGNSVLYNPIAQNLFSTNTYKTIIDNVITRVVDDSDVPCLDDYISENTSNDTSGGLTLDFGVGIGVGVSFTSSNFDIAFLMKYDYFHITFYDGHFDIGTDYYTGIEISSNNVGIGLSESKFHSYFCPECNGSAPPGVCPGAVDRSSDLNPEIGLGNSIYLISGVEWNVGYDN